MSKQEAPTLRTARLILRRRREKDIPFMLDLFGNAEVRQYLGGYPPSDEAAMRYMIRRRSSTDWVAALADTDEYIGECMLLKVVDNYLAEIGYYFRRSYWGQGYAEEAANAVISYCTDTLHLSRLCATIDHRNERSRKLIEKLGFTWVALLPESDFGGRVANVVYYSRKLPSGKERSRERTIMIQVLLVEDDLSIVRSLTEFLESEGFSVRQVPGQADAVNLAKSEGFDLILMDVSLHDGNGFAACAAIKAFSDVPVIFLTASGDEGSTVAGFELGADDYIAKPFRPRELVSRMRNALRRRGGTRSVVQLENVSVDTDKGVITKNGHEIALSALEYKILQVFIGNRGRMLSRARLLEEIWDIAGDYVNDNTLTVYIKRIREKIEDDPANPKIIRTIRGLGYRVD